MLKLEELLKLSEFKNYSNMFEDEDLDDFTNNDEDEDAEDDDYDEGLDV